MGDFVSCQPNLHSYLAGSMNDLCMELNKHHTVFGLGLMSIADTLTLLLLNSVIGGCTAAISASR